MFCVFFTEDDVYDYETVQHCDTDKYASLYKYLLAEGIYLPPSQFEVSFISCAHELDDIDKTIAAFENALNKME